MGMVRIAIPFRSLYRGESKVKIYFLALIKALRLTTSRRPEL